MNLEQTLDRITEWMGKYASFPHEHAAPTLALWAAHTWVSTAFYTTPRLVLSSPVPGSGKTRILELLNGLCWNPKMTVSSSTAALFRRIGAAHKDNEAPPTVLFDEIDAVFSAARASEQTEQLRALMNSGYKRGATVDRCEGDATEMKVIEWPVFSPLALAGLAGHLPDTIVTRSIVIEMKKRARGEHVAPYRERDAEAEAVPMTNALRAWATGDAVNTLAAARPDMPNGVEDRHAEVWEPLLAIADMAGGHWPETARRACTEFVFAPSHRPPSMKQELLRDVRNVMGHGDDPTRRAVDKIRTTELLQLLKRLDESPWANLDGGGLTPRRLANLLAGYSVTPVKFRDEMGTGRGYILAGNAQQDGLADAWGRYLPPPHPAVSETCGTTGTNGTPQFNEGIQTEQEGGAGGTSESLRLSADPPCSGTSNGDGTENTPMTGTVPHVPHVPSPHGGAGAEREVMARAAVYESLAKHPQTVEHISKSVTLTYRPQTADILAILVSEGKAENHDDGTYSRP